MGRDASATVGLKRMPTEGRELLVHPPQRKLGRQPREETVCCVFLERYAVYAAKADPTPCVNSRLDGADAEA